MTVKRVILIRPGETNWNREGRWQGWVSNPLSDYGRAQALALGRFIRNIGMSTLYSSDLRRAKETAEILAKQLGYDPTYDERWRERKIGEWQGMTLAEIRAWYPEQYSQLQANVDDFRVPGGESRSEVRKRVVAAFKDLLAQDRGNTIGLISHTTSTHMLLYDLVPDYDIYSHVLGNTSVTTIALDANNQWSIIAANDLSHLEGLTSRSFGELEEKNDSGD
ncbi:MAG: histidine phosphatase family protein [Anaerolineae bacterium]|nr:histidine phosphatase family protein [Anaerolineae bacterium]